MNAVASLLSLALGLAVLTTGAQKVVFNPTASRLADELGWKKRSYQSAGVVDIVAAILLVVGLDAAGGSVLGLLNEIGAVLAVVATLVELVARRGLSGGIKRHYFSLGVIVAALLELVFRLIS